MRHAANQSRQGTRRHRCHPRRHHDILEPMERNTRQRDAIRQVFEEIPRPLGPTEVLEHGRNHVSKLGIATVYRTMRLFEEAGVIERLDFGDGRARYEAAPEAHHDHLIDVETGKVVEFVDPELEALQRVIAEKLGYRLVDHRMELYGVRIDREDKG